MIRKKIWSSGITNEKKSCWLGKPRVDAGGWAEVLGIKGSLQETSPLERPGLCLFRITLLVCLSKAFPINLDVWQMLLYFTEHNWAQRALL